MPGTPSPTRSCRPLESYKDRPNHIGDPRSINKIEYCDEVFQRLALNPEIMRVVNALTGALSAVGGSLCDTGLRGAALRTGNRPQYHGAALVRSTAERSGELPLHGGFNGGEHGQHANDPRAGAGLRNPANDFQSGNGRVFASYVNCALSLVDVPEGAGGFVCVPCAAPAAPALSHHTHSSHDGTIGVCKLPLAQMATFQLLAAVIWRRWRSGR